MDDHKLVMIFIFLDFQNMKKMQSFNENMLRNIFRIWPYENKNFFFKREIDLKVFEIFFENDLNFFLKYFKKTGYFNTGFIFYSVNIQPNIMQNW
jgi:hypothetical protein